MVEFKDYGVNFLLLGLFIFALISFLVGVGTNYGHDDDFVKDDRMNIDELEDRIESTNTQAQSWEEKFTSDNPFVAVAGIILFSIWGIITLIWSSIFGLFNVIIQGASNVLGIPSMVTGTLTATLIIGLIFAAWRSVKSG